jgi:hypothetical protein
LAAQPSQTAVDGFSLRSQKVEQGQDRPAGHHYLAVRMFHVAIP